MPIVNGISARQASASMNPVQDTTSTQTTSNAGLVVSYGDPARAQGLQNMLHTLDRLLSDARATIAERNPGLQ